MEQVVQVPAGLGKLDCTKEELGNASVTNPFIHGGNQWIAPPGGACWARFVAKCETQHLSIWRGEEGKKTVAKLFTIVFVLVGIGSEFLRAARPPSVFQVPTLVTPLSFICLSVCVSVCPSTS